jgi:hypothetical protein
MGTQWSLHENRSSNLIDILSVDRAVSRCGQKVPIVLIPPTPFSRIKNKVSKHPPSTMKHELLSRDPAHLLYCGLSSGRALPDLDSQPAERCHRSANKEADTCCGDGRSWSSKV